MRLPPVNLPGTPNLKALDMGQLRARADSLLRADELGDSLNLAEARLANVRQLLRERHKELEADPRGEPIVRHEIVAWTPDVASLAAIRAAGFEIVRTRRFAGLEQNLLVIRVPDTVETAAALESLRALSPATVFDFNHIYLESAARAEFVTSASTTASAVVAAVPMTGDASPAKLASQEVRVGLVDGGLWARHAVFKDGVIHRHGCDGKEVPSEHGTAVASLMAGHDKHFNGVQPGATLYAADIYCGSATGGALDKIADALAWLAAEKVAVINLSIVGPPNQALETMVGALLRRGHLLVAAVGNDGPAAPPLYPASYAGVIGVSAVDAARRPLPEAARGAQVMFAAPGANMVVATPGTPPFRIVRGTSFAAPIVAAMAAAYLPLPDAQAAKKALASLIGLATAGHPPLMSKELGYGVLGEAYRVEPDSFR
ncbi:S8 family serine peptidase [Undibacterium oligocarboniphilum]|uniref:S8 family serine peptidase n=1 Tax=Undibacterium oligocarboniphilum TaxID=666702 RepID=A0A850QG65_9BURK|nr:S8 family serine peptidase [Undibacterium oligocarboniphilum]NVO77967.1 S8 family serine peptidase [Undibacterium oligocarboniphilum]